MNNLIKPAALLYLLALWTLPLSVAYAQDTVSPTAFITNANDVSIEGIALDNVLVDRVELNIRNSSAQSWNGSAFVTYARVLTVLQSDGNWQYHFPSQLPADNYVVVTFAFDSSGNVQDPREFDTFSVQSSDTESPTASISNASTDSISGISADNESLDRVELAIRNSSFQYWNGTSFGDYGRVLTTLQDDGDWYYQFSSALPADDYVVVTFAFDSAGNVQNPRDVANFSFVPIDSEPPTASVSYTSSTAISGISSDNESVDRVELAIRNSSFQYWNGTSFGDYARVLTTLQTDGDWQYQFTSTLPTDDYVVVTFAFDSAGNIQSPRDVDTFSVVPQDSEAPTATITETSRLAISGFSNDNVSVDRVELVIRNSSYQYWSGSSFGDYTRVLTNLELDGSWQYEFTPVLPTDDYVVVTFAFDTSGNFQNPRDVATFSVASIDDQPPTAAIALFNDTSISGTSEDNVGLDRVELAIRDADSQYWNGTVFGNYSRVLASLETNGDWEYQISPSLSSGTYTVVAFPFDTSNNVPADRDTVTITVQPENSFISQGNGSWGDPIALPSVPVSAANLPDGRVLTWAGKNRFSYQYGVDDGRTYTSTFNPTTGVVEESLVSETSHDMFCPGANMLADGSIMVSGGSSMARTSIFNPISGSWSVADTMNIPRAYNANTTLEDGSVLTLGGSWAEETLCRTGVSPSQSDCPDKLAEVWTQEAGWTVLSGISADVLRTDDDDGLFRSDNHMWLFTIAGGKVLHAGPSKAMHLLDVSGDGSIEALGNRADDDDAMNGNAVMFDVGKLLTVGGGRNYENVDATDDAFIVEVNGDVVTSRRTGSMNTNRAYHNSVVLPNGEVVVIGGQSYPIPFTDADSAMEAELWNPINETFRVLASMSVPRNYHSIALLLNDGRIVAGGGGLCGNCSTNHADVEIFTPPYLYDNDGNLRSRPEITSAPSTASHGNIINVYTDSEIVSVVLMRAAVATHSINNDQRRIPLTFVGTGNNSYAATIPSDTGIATPGNYMLFVLDDSGTPSVSELININ